MKAKYVKINFYLGAEGEPLVVAADCHSILGNVRIGEFLKEKVKEYFRETELLKGAKNWSQLELYRLQKRARKKLLLEFEFLKKKHSIDKAVNVLADRYGIAEDRLLLFLDLDDGTTTGTNTETT